MIRFVEEKYTSLGSSNNVIKRAIENDHPEGLVACAYEQTAGYGRLGRSWVSPFGGSYFSILLRPTRSLQELPTLGLLVALTLRRTIAGFLPPEVCDRVKIKWPNDVVLVPADGLSQRQGAAFDKLCGISFERHAGATCVGIGVNVFHPAIEKEVGGKNAPAYVADCMGEALTAAGISPKVGTQGLTAVQQACIDRVRALFLEQFAPLYDRWNAEGFDFLLEEYARELCLRGRRVSMVNQLDQSMLVGVVVGIDESARLLVQTDYGTVEHVAVGEVALI